MIAVAAVLLLILLILPHYVRLIYVGYKAINSPNNEIDFGSDNVAGVPKPLSKKQVRRTILITIIYAIAVIADVIWGTYLVAERMQANMRVVTLDIGFGTLYMAGFYLIIIYFSIIKAWRDNPPPKHRDIPPYTGEWTKYYNNNMASFPKAYFRVVGVTWLFTFGLFALWAFLTYLVTK